MDDSTRQWDSTSGGNAHRSKQSCHYHSVVAAHKNRGLACISACWLPSVAYPLSTTTMLDKDLQSVQLQATASFLQKFGFNKHFPRAILFGPREMGGWAPRNGRLGPKKWAVLLCMNLLWSKALLRSWLWWWSTFIIRQIQGVLSKFHYGQARKGICCTRRSRH